MVQAMRHGGRLDGRQAAICAALPVVLGLLLGAKHLRGVLAGGLINPDSYMRMVRLREILRLHYPTSIVLRDSSGHGTLLHWSHLLDSLLCLFATPLGWVMPQHTALHLVAALAGPVFMAGLGVAVAWAVAPFVRTPFSLVRSLLAGLSPSIFMYGLPARHIIMSLPCW